MVSKAFTRTAIFLPAVPVPDRLTPTVLTDALNYEKQFVIEGIDDKTIYKNSPAMLGLSTRVLSRAAPPPRPRPRGPPRGPVPRPGADRGGIL